MNIQLSEHFNYRKLLRFTIPSIIMMVFTSIYGVVDGFFVSNIVGKIPFAAVNFIMPLLMVLAVPGFMFGTGGSALIAKTMGEGNKQKANNLFSFFVFCTFVVGIVVSALSITFLPQIVRKLGAEGQMLEDCIIYGRIILASLPFFMLQLEFQTFFVTAERPKLGLCSTVIAGVTNIILDVLFMAVLRWGIVGAALATALSEFVGGIVPVIYFSRKNTSLLRLQKFSFDGKALLKACVNGSSELMSNISMSLVGILYNLQLLKYAGENGIAAYGVLMYVNFVFISMFIGYIVGTAPVISYHYGAENHSELKSLLRKSIVIISSFAVVMFILAQALANSIAQIFVGYDKELMAMTLRGFRFFSFSFLFAGFAIFVSGFFTALNDGLTSAIISFLRTLIFQIVAVIIFPIILGIDGIWISVVFAEFMAVALTVFCIFLKQKKYQY